MGSLWAVMRMAMTTKPSTKFIPAPASMMRARCQTGASFRGIPAGFSSSGEVSAMPRAPLSGELPPSAAEGFDCSSACLLSGLSSPSSATKPPTGRARMLYWVPLRTRLHSTGPMPMENSLTCTPQSFATMKWPNSWMAITALNTNTAAIKVTIKDISSPYRCALTKARAILSHSYTSARV